MSDFCRQCTRDILGMPEEENDFVGMITKEQWIEGWCSIGICEGCAGGNFDYEGNCLGGCMESNHKSPHEDEVTKEEK